MNAKHLKELRTSAGLTQAELATKLGVSRQTIFLWEASRATPNGASLHALARLFGATVDDIAGENAVIELIGGRVIPPVLLPVYRDLNVKGDTIEYGEAIGTEAAAGSIDQVSQCYFLCTSDASIANDSLHSEILLLIRPQIKLDYSQLGLFYTTLHGLTVSRYYPSSEAVILQPINPSFYPTVLVRRDIKDLKILGRVLEIRRRIE